MLPAFLSRPVHLFGVVALSINVASAATRIADSIATLQAQIKEAVPGDTITLKNGAYTTTAALTVRCAGTVEQPITIAAESVGGVEIAGTHGFNITTPSAHVIISGFKFTHASGKNAIGTDTSHVRFTRNVFLCSGDGPYLSVLGDDAQVDHNEFADKKTLGSMLAVSGVGSQIARRLWIHHNYFHDLTTAGPTGAEMIRLGLSALSLSTGAALVEHNLFVRCRGENELISNRSSGNTFRYNTLIDSPTAQFTLRHGNDCHVYGNIFRNTEGLRIFGDRHQIFSNYFEGNYIGINLGNGSTDIASGGSLTGHDRPDDCIIAFNTLVDNRTHYQLSRRAPDALGATRTTFANNILAGSGLAAKIEGPNTGAIWTGNLLWTNGGAGDLPPDGLTKADPRLAPGPDGLKRPQPDSPALDSGEGTFAMVTSDLDGQPRTGKKAKGADELSDAPAIARLLSSDDVGPGAK